MKSEMLAMILAGGKGTRLGKLTQDIAKPAVPFGGKYRIIDFPLSNCANSGITTVGVMTQYEPLVLNDHIGNGAPWGWMLVMAGQPFYNLTQVVKEKNGLKEQPMRFIKMLPSSIHINLNMSLSCLVTIFIK